jgi:hypothetical protein
LACDKPIDNAECMAHSIAAEYSLPYPEQVDLEFVINIMLDNEMPKEDIKSVVKIILDINVGEHHVRELEQGKKK